MREIGAAVVAEGRELDPANGLDRMHARGMFPFMLELIDEVLRQRKWAREMVEMAASGGRLDGYRELADELAAKDGEIERLTDENKVLRHTHRWDVSPQVDDSLLVCRGLHEKDEKCDLEHYVPAGRLHDAIRERDELRRQLAEAGQDARRYRWLRDDGSGFEITVREEDEDGHETWVSGYPPNELDIAIDAAMGLTRPAEEA
jgi:hypothetical protein